MVIYLVVSMVIYLVISGVGAPHDGVRRRIVSEKFEEIRQVLEREGMIPAEVH